MAKWEGYQESSAMPHGALRGNIASVPLGNLAADRQADSGAFVFRPAMQALEDFKYAIQVLLIEADSPVFYNEPEHAIHRGAEIGVLRVHPYGRRLALLTELQSVANQILQELTHLHGIRVNAGQIAYFYHRASLGDPYFEVRQDFPRHLRQIHRQERLRLAGHPGETQQIQNQRLHPLGRVQHAIQIIPALLVQRPAAAALETVSECLYLAQRLLQIVGGHGGEVLQLTVTVFEPERGAFEILIRGSQLPVGAVEFHRAFPNAILQTLIQHSDLGLGAFVIFDVGAGAEPAHHRSLRVANRARPPQMPAIGVVRSTSKAIQYLQRFASGQRMRPQIDEVPEVVRVQDRRPTPVPGLRDGHSRVVVPPPIVVVEVSVRSRRPDDLRHRVGKFLETGLAVR